MATSRELALDHLYDLPDGSLTQAEVRILVTEIEDQRDRATLLAEDNEHLLAIAESMFSVMRRLLGDGNLRLAGDAALDFERARNHLEFVSTKAEIAGAGPEGSDGQ